MTDIGEAFIRIRPDPTGFRGETTAAVRRDIQRTEREFSRFGRGALVGTGALGGLGRAAAFASTSFIGGAGLVYAIKSTIDAAKESQVVLGQTENAVKRSGIAWGQYKQQIQEAALATANLSGFDDERLLRTFSTLVRRTGDVTKALKLNALAADVARGRNIELETATQLVLRASLGQAGALRRLGIDARKGADGLELVALLSEKYAGSAEKYSKTAAGAQDRFNVALQNTQEIIGAELLPVLTTYLNRGADWLSQSKNQERIQRDVHAAVSAVGTALHDAAEILDTTNQILGPVVEHFGGLSNVLKGLAAIKLISWFTGVRLGMAGVGTQAGLAATQVGVLRGRLLRLRALGTIGVTIAIGYEVAQGAQRFDKWLGGTGFGQAIGAGTNLLSGSDVQELLGKGHTPQEIADKFGAAGLIDPSGMAALKKAADAQRGFGSFDFLDLPKPKRVLSAPDVSGTSVQGAANLTAMGRNALALSNAQRAGSETAELVALRTQRELLAKAITTEQGRLDNARTTEAAKKYAANLQGLVDKDTSALAQITGIEERAASAAESAQRDAEAAAEKARVAAERAAALRAKQYRDRLHIQEQTLRTAVKTTHDSAQADRKLTDFLRREAHDKLLTGVERSDYAARLADETGREQERDKRIAEQLRKAATLGATVINAASDAFQKVQEHRLEVAKKAKATALQIREGGLSLARQAAGLAEARAGTDQKLLDKALTLERRADLALIKFYKERIAATKGLERQGYRQQLISAQMDLAGLGKKKTAGSTFTLQQFAEFAQSQFKTYGDNYGPRGTPLSSQDVRGGIQSAFNMTVKQKGTVNVTQHFHAPTRPSQAMNDARSASRYLN